MSYLATPDKTKLNSTDILDLATTLDAFYHTNITLLGIARYQSAHFCRYFWSCQAASRSSQMALPLEPVRISTQRAATKTKTKARPKRPCRCDGDALKCDSANKRTGRDFPTDYQKRMLSLMHISKHLVCIPVHALKRWPIPETRYSCNGGCCRML